MPIRPFVCLLLSFLIFSSPAYSIETENVQAPVGSRFKAVEPDDDSLVSIIDQQRNHVRWGLTVLGAWSVANIATGFTAAGNESGENYYFWRMNAYWNMVNLGIAGLGFYLESRKLGKSLNPADALREVQNAQVAYWLNAGLDVGFIGMGFLLRSKGNALGAGERKNQNLGYGKSLILQGSFLLVLDVLMGVISHQQNEKILGLLNGIAIGQNSIGLQWRI